MTESVTAEIRQLHGATGDAFAEVLRQDLMPTAAAAEWGRTCLAVASSGWHAWEAAGVYIRLTPVLVEQLGVDVTLDAGRYGESLSGYSFEPSQTWFLGLERLVGTGDPQQRIELATRTGNKVREQYPHASNLISEFFRRYAALVGFLSFQDLEAWTTVLGEVMAEGRQETVDFLALAADAIPWSDVRDLYRRRAGPALQYARTYPSLKDHLGDDVLSAWTPVLLHFADRADDLAPLLECLLTATRRTMASRTLRESLWQLDEIELAACLVSHEPRLPWDAGLRPWIEAGVALDTPAARLAHFNLESRGSIRLLDSLRGRISFDEHKRVLQLYAEAMAGERLVLEEAEDEHAGITFDGHLLTLPPWIDRFEKREENFEFYRTAIQHQLGYQEFGFFAGPAAIRRFLGQFENPVLADIVFAVIEAGRIDWQLAQRYPGTAKVLSRLKQDALAARDPAHDGPLERLLRATLDDEEEAALTTILAPVRQRGASLSTCFTVAEAVIASIPEDTPVILPVAVDYRGRFSLHAAIGHALSLQLEDALDVSDPDELTEMLTQFDPKDAEIEELKEGDVDPRLGKLITELDKDIPLAEDAEPLDKETIREGLEAMAGRIGKQAREDKRYLYDEWDHGIDDYRQRWCTLKEIRQIEEKPEYVVETLGNHRDTAKAVRRQLNMLKPELLRKVKGVVDGDELDIERTVEAVVDRRTGSTPDETIYVQRQRKDRDVSTLFLLDMSASTDDTIPDPAAEPVEYPEESDDDFLAAFWERQDEAAKGDRIIDLEKQAVILMADALEELGDSYSICGFSGYGRDDVEYYLCKDFDEPYDLRARGRIGGIKPCRSTRMGPAIRHATRRLVQTESRIKALIIISDGYPQDFDYGTDRSSKEYGVKDTTKALSEARQQGVQSFCLTVDPSGHDYLRDMCPDRQYMVIQDIKQLPSELSKVYQSLTG